jgi:shikimate dehydrogenase
MTAALRPQSVSKTGRSRDGRLLLGLIGAGIGQSRSPAQHEGEARAQGLNCIYRLIDLDALQLTPAALPDLLTAAERFGFAGLNITFPCKQVVMQHLDELSEHAEALGAVNTVVLDQGKRIGHNTDWSGYGEAFRAALPEATGDRVVLFGGGGAGAAVAYAHLTLGCSNLALVEMDTDRAEALLRQMEAKFGTGRMRISTDPKADVAAAQGVVNATPVGMAKYPGMPLPAEWLTPDHWVSDIIYFPLETELLAAARKLGCRTVDGSGMNVRQAAEAFRHFSGLEPDVARMRRLFDAADGRQA